MTSDKYSIDVDEETTVYAEVSGSSETVTWSVSGNCVSYSTRGNYCYVTGKYGGNATVTATTSNGHSDKVTITVRERNTVKLSDTEISIVCGDSKQLSATITGPNSSVCTWKSENTAVATLTSNGKSATIRGVSPGTTYVQATANDGAYARCKVVVTQPENYENVLIDGIYYNLDTGTGTASVFGRKDITDADLIIPQKVTYLGHEYTVTEIFDQAFWEDANIVSVTLPSTLTRIGDSAFGACTSLASIALPDRLEMIDAYAFCKCSNLKSVTFGSGLKEIGEAAFQECETLASVALPDQVEMISAYAFF